MPQISQSLIDHVADMLKGHKTEVVEIWALRLRDNDSTPSRTKFCVEGTSAPHALVPEVVVQIAAGAEASVVVDALRRIVAELVNDWDAVMLPPGDERVFFSDPDDGARASKRSSGLAFRQHPSVHGS